MTYTETEVNYKGKATSMTVPTKCKTCPTQILTWMKQSFVIRFLDCGTHKKKCSPFFKRWCLFVCSWGPHQNKKRNESFDEHLENVDWHGFNRHICIKFISALANSFSALNTVAKLPSRMSLIELFSWIVDTKHNVPSSISILLDFKMPLEKCAR